MSTEPNLTTTEAVLLRLIEEQNSLIAELRQLLRDSMDSREAAENRHSQERRSFTPQRLEQPIARSVAPSIVDRLTAPPTAAELVEAPPQRLPIDIAAAIEQARFSSIQRTPATEMNELAMEAAKAAASGVPPTS